MKSIWKFTWEDYGISRNLRDELKAFCKQYEEKKSKLNRQQDTEFHEKYRKDINNIEQSALKANPDIYQYILKSVTYGIPYELIEYDRELGRIPVSRTVFYGYRRLFSLLSKANASRKHRQMKSVQIGPTFLLSW